MADYRYPHFKASLLLEDRAFFGGVGPGNHFPAFDLSTIDGGRISSSDVLGRTPLFVYFASVT
jgi:hypothetical protein